MQPAPGRDGGWTLQLRFGLVGLRSQLSPRSCRGVQPPPCSQGVQKLREVSGGSRRPRRKDTGTPAIGGMGRQRRHRGRDRSGVRLPGLGTSL